MLDTDTPVVAAQPPVTVQAPAPSPLATQQSDPSQQTIPSQPAPDTPGKPQLQNSPHPVLSALGGWHALMGSTTQYQQTSEGPQPVQVPNKPGQLFRSILAGAMMGAAAGSEAHAAGGGIGPGIKAGIGPGFSAVQQNTRMQQQKAQQDAQQQFKNKMEADKAAQDATAADTENQVRKAQIAQANAETLKTNQLTQGLSYEQHANVAKDDAARISTYKQAGLAPRFEDITESQMQDLIKNSPGASTLDWRHTGVTTVPGKGPGDPPSYEYTLSAYDPKAPLPLAQATIDQWEKDGLFKYHPEYKDVVAKGKTLTVGQFTAMDQQAQNLYNQNLARTKDTEGTQLHDAQIGEAKARISAEYATANHENMSTKELRDNDNQKKEEQVAWDHLSSVGNDTTKLTPQERIVLSRASRPALQSVVEALKLTASEAESGDKDAAASLPGLHMQLDTLTRLSNLGSTATGPAAAPPSSDAVVNRAYTAVQNLDPDAARAAINNAASLTPDQKKAVLDQWQANQKAHTTAGRQAVGNVLLHPPVVL